MYVRHANVVGRSFRFPETLLFSGGPGGYGILGCGKRTREKSQSATTGKSAPRIKVLHERTRVMISEKGDMSTSAMKIGMDTSILISYHDTSICLLQSTRFRENAFRMGRSSEASAVHLVNNE